MSHKFVYIHGYISIYIYGTPPRKYVQIYLKNVKKNIPPNTQKKNTENTSKHSKKVVCVFLGGYHIYIYLCEQQKHIQYMTYDSLVFGPHKKNGHQIIGNIMIQLFHMPC